MPPSTSPSVETAAIPSRVDHDPDAGRLTVVADVLPAGRDDVSVAVGTTRVRITVAREHGVHDGYVSPPSGRVFTDDREAYYNNGVLTVAVGTRRSRARVSPP